MRGTRFACVLACARACTLHPLDRALAYGASSELKTQRRLSSSSQWVSGPSYGVRQQCSAQLSPAQLNSGLLVGVRQRCCPAPSPAHHCWYCCLSHAMRGVRCAGSNPLQKGGGGTTGVNQLQARVWRSSTAHPAPLLRSPLSQECQHKQTRHQITHAGCGKSHSAAPAGWERHA